MTAHPVHQLLHGYRKGHQLLAGSCRLPAAAADLVAQLSDLPGSLPPGFQFTASLTVYPVPRSSFHAVARTWPDAAAARSGCVITHTLLVPSPLWEAADDPERFAGLHALPPASGDYSRYTTPTEVPSAQPLPTATQAAPGGSAAHEEFVRKFFGEGIRPLVFVDCVDPERLIWSVLRLAWPSLRSRLAAGSLCFQPRALGDRPFDLMFAPAAARPRFHSVPPEAVVPSGGAGQVRAEPWLRDLSAALLTATPRSPIQHQIAEFGDFLGDDPAAIGSLFTARELRGRLPGAPTAGIGLLDLVESLTPTEEAAAVKKAAVAAALAAAAAAPPADGLRCLYMLSERLGRPAFSRHADDAATQIASVVSRFTAADAAAAVAAPGASGRRVPPVLAGPYAEGLLRGLEQVGQRHPPGLSVLADCPEVGAFAVASRPQLAADYLTGAETTRGEAANLLARWANTASTPARAGLREHVLPNATASDVPLVAELLHDLPVGEVGDTLDRLVRSGSVREREVCRVLADSVAAEHPAALIRWAETAPAWAAELAEVVAGAYAATRAGLESILTTGFCEPRRRAQVIAAFLENVMAAGRAGWLRDYAAGTAAFLAPLILERDALTAPYHETVGRVLAACPYVPLATEQLLLPSIEEHRDTSAYDDLVSRAVFSAVAEAIHGRIGRDVCERWLSTPWALAWIEQATHHQLSRLFDTPLGREDRTRAWAVLSRLPDAAYQGRHAAALCGLTRALVLDGDGVADEGSAAAWQAVITRAVMHSPFEVRIRLAVDALVVSFHHTHLPLGGVVAAAFRTIYDSVAGSDSPPHETGVLFGFFDWDRAKELRKTLISSFLDSRWRPGDLAVAAGDESLVRKIIKRLCRKRRGEAYLVAMVEDLVNRNDPPALAIRDLVRGLAADTGYYEPWD